MVLHWIIGNLITRYQSVQCEAVHCTGKHQVLDSGPFWAVNQSMFTEVEVAIINDIAKHTITFVLLYTKEHVLFVCDQACEQLTQEWIKKKW